MTTTANDDTPLFDIDNAYRRVIFFKYEEKCLSARLKVLEPHTNNSFKGDADILQFVLKLDELNQRVDAIKLQISQNRVAFEELKNAIRVAESTKFDEAKFNKDIEEAVSKIGGLHG